MKWILLLCCFSCLLFADGKTVFTERFDSPESLNKWRKVERKGGAKFSVKGNALSVLHGNIATGGGFVEIEIPVIRKGQLDFDITVSPDRAPAGGIALTLDIYNISTFWHDACGDWRMYFAEPEVKRLPFFWLEPVGHKKICEFPKYRKVHCRIKFDADADLVEFYADDMKDPAAIRYDVSVIGHAMYQGGYLRIGSFGYIPSPYETHVSNLVLTEDTAEQTAVTERKYSVIFNGISSDHYPMAELLKDSGTEQRFYPWNSPGSCASNSNNYQYFKMPGFQTVDQAKYIIFNDAPNVPEALQKRILDSVHEGAHLLIMGGFWTLSKGFFQNTSLGDALPVEFGSAWKLIGDGKTPFLIPGTKTEVWYLLNLPAKADAQILRKAGNIPMLVKKQHGKGTISVLTATAGGPDTPNVFWRTPVLKELVRDGLK